MVLHGKRNIVGAGTTGTVTAIALQRSCELNRTCEMREIAASNENSQEFKPGRKGWMLTVSGLMSSLSALLTEGTLYTIEISDGSATQRGTGDPPQVKVTGTIGNLAQQSVVFQGTGALGAGT